MAKLVVAFLVALSLASPASAFEAICFPAASLRQAGGGPVPVDAVTAREILRWLDARTPPPAFHDAPVLVKDVPDKGRLHVVVILTDAAACDFIMTGGERDEILRLLGA